MNPASNSRSGGRDATRGANEADTRNKQTTPNATPSTDMQSDDAGTAASGNGGRANPADSAMKQEHKTDSERGSGR
jgi:hypothetical protein